MAREATSRQFAERQREPRVVRAAARDSPTAAQRLMLVRH
jgi:hypothetical protein